MMNEDLSGLKDNHDNLLDLKNEAAFSIFFNAAACLGFELSSPGLELS